MTVAIDTVKGVEAWGIHRFDGFDVALCRFGAGDEEIFSGMLNLMNFGEDGKLSHFITIETDFVSDDEFEVAEHAFAAGMALANPCGDDILVFDEKGDSTALEGIDMDDLETHYYTSD